jgi:hypothetical protein
MNGPGNELCRRTAVASTRTSQLIESTLSKFRIGVDSHAHSVTSVDAVSVTDFPPREFAS